jgi:vacuolar protein sorting-associated protein 16
MKTFSQWNSGQLRTIGWTDSEELLCVQDDGVVLIYNIFGQYLHKFSMGQEAIDTKIIDAKIFPTSQGTGCAVMTTHFRIFIINSYKDPKVRQLPEIPSKFSPLSLVQVKFKNEKFSHQNFSIIDRIFTRSNQLVCCY